MTTKIAATATWDVKAPTPVEPEPRCGKCGTVLEVATTKAPGGEVLRTWYACTTCPFFAVDPPFPPPKKDGEKAPEAKS
jgi:hypothetical protein